MFLGGCSVQRLAVNALADALAAEGSVFESENDPELVREALPFGLKLMDGILAEQPNHRALLLAAARGYLLYSYAFVNMPAEQSRLENFDRTVALRDRSRNLYLRAHYYASRVLELDYPGVTAALLAEPHSAVLEIAAPERDVPALYWTAASLGLAISVSRNEPALLARLPEVEALLDRALELDEDWNEGTLHEFAISFRAAGASTDREALEAHYQRALALSQGRRASLYVTWAESVAVPEQDRATFTELLEKALAIDVDAYPEQRLLNVLAQQRARWLQQQTEELFLE